MNLITLWKKKNQIFEGIKNSVFQREDIEVIARERMEICKACPSKLYDETGEGCVLPGPQPCCNEAAGGCGCSLSWKTRALSDECPMGHWKAVLSDLEEAALKAGLGIEED